MKIHVDSQPKSPYPQSNGTLQVMKARDGHLVLTFCQESPHEEFFTIILFRKPNMNTPEVRNYDLH